MGEREGMKAKTAKYAYTVNGDYQIFTPLGRNVSVLYKGSGRTAQ
jgi:hypothetical protein